MSFSSYDPHTRYRKRHIARLINFAVIGSVLFCAGLIGFWIGGQDDAHKINSLKVQLQETEEQKQEAESILMQLRTEAQTATMRYEQLQNEFQEKLPEGSAIAELNDLVRKHLDEGMDPERLAFVIRSARPPRNCAEPETRRFVISNPAYKGADSTVEITEGPIIIKGSGSSSKNKDGKAEAWYDPSKAVAISFTGPNGQEEIKKGIMPLRHSVVAGGRQYRFTVEEGARSFAKVIFDSCDYP